MFRFPCCASTEPIAARSNLPAMYISVPLGNGTAQLGPPGLVTMPGTLSVPGLPGYPYRVEAGLQLRRVDVRTHVFADGDLQGSYLAPADSRNLRLACSSGFGMSRVIGFLYWPSRFGALHGRAKLAKK